MKINSNWLRENDACPDQVELFESTFGSSAKITLPNIQKAVRAGLNLSWLVPHLLSPRGFKAYKKALAPALKTFDKALAPAWKAYNEATATAQKTYEEAKAMAWKTYEEAKAMAWKTYEEAKVTAFWAEFKGEDKEKP